MQIVFLDYETYYDNDYTLTRMTTEEYVRDRRFEAHCVSVVSGGKGVAIPQEHLKAFFDSYDWSDKAVCAHHAQFDGLILSHHYGIKPKFWFDTISMARTLYGPHQRVSLAKLLEKFGMQPKTIDYNEFKGKRWYQMSDRTQKMLLDGSVHDSIQTEKLFYLMLNQGFPTNELELIDRTVRMFTEPTCEGDLTALRELCRSEINRKEEMMHELRIGKADLQSAAKFSALLQAEGVEIEYKYGKTVDKTTGDFKRVPAFAKTDGFMDELLNSDSPRVRALAEARLGAKSTINETRAGRLLKMTERGSICMYHHHAGTHTLRPTGGDKMNFINMPRDGLIRKTIRAPEGHKLSIKDYSQFELRICLKLAGQEDKLADLANDVDIYSGFSTKLYGRTITKLDERERYIGKQVVLGSQYGQGSEKLFGELNFKHKVSVDMEFCEQAVSVYRKEEYPLVVKLWKEAGKLLPRMANRETFDWKCFHFEDGKCYAPNGSFMFFDHLEWRANSRQMSGGAWFMEKKPGKWDKMYGAKLVENLVQFLQRCIAADKLTQIDREYPIALWPYDEYVHVIPEDEAEEVHQSMMDLMCIPPVWMPDLPIGVEGSLSDRYDK